MSPYYKVLKIDDNWCIIKQFSLDLKYSVGLERIIESNNIEFFKNQYDTKPIPMISTTFFKDCLKLRKYYTKQEIMNVMYKLIKKDFIAFL